MKRSFNYIITATCLAVLLFTQSGCDKDWLDVNYNPREISSGSATPDVLMAPLFEGMVRTGVQFDIVSTWMGYWCSSQFPSSLNITNYTELRVGGGNAGGEVAFAEGKALSLGQDFYAGIAKVIKGHFFATLVDGLNNVPYSEAYRSDVLRPRYDSGQLIYEGIVKDLTAASVLIKNADITKNVRINTVDIMFHGDKLKWLQFINTLKLRLLIHQANRPGRESYIAQQIQVIKEEGSGFLSVDAAINPGYVKDQGYFKFSRFVGRYSSHNPNGGSFVYGGGNGFLGSGITSTTLAHANIVALTFLKENNDPRLGFFYSTTDSLLPLTTAQPFPQPEPRRYRGSRFGLAVNQLSFPSQNLIYLSAIGGSRNAANLVSDTASGILKGINMDDWVLTSVESLFLQAEAIYRGWLPGIPEEAYKAAVKQSFRWLNVGKSKASPQLSDAIFQQWYNSEVTLGNTKVSWAAATDKYKLIMFQKYIALNGIDPLESWADYRRNGRFPDLPVSVDPARLGDAIPSRFAYALTEYELNPEHVKAQGTIDVFNGKIWWMP